MEKPDAPADLIPTHGARFIGVGIALDLQRNSVKVARD